MSKNIGFYGGTFDPVHLGHIHLAIEALEKHHLDEVWFCPNSISPHKTVPLTSTEHRLEMIKLAIMDIPQFKVIANEIFKDKTSYTIDTLQELIHKDSFKFRLIIGDDCLERFSQWHEWEKIIELAPPIIIRRYGIIPDHNSPLYPMFKKGFKHNASMEISGTCIRERLKKKLYCGHLLPAKVLNYIYQNHLYE